MNWTASFAILWYCVGHFFFFPNEDGRSSVLEGQTLHGGKYKLLTGNRGCGKGDFGLSFVRSGKSGRRLIVRACLAESRWKRSGWMLWWEGVSERTNCPSWMSVLDLGPSVEQRQILMDELPANTSESWCLRIFLFACFSDECRILSWPLVYYVPALSVCQLPKPGRSLVICAMFPAPLSPSFCFSLGTVCFTPSELYLFLTLPFAIYPDSWMA